VTAPLTHRNVPGQRRKWDLRNLNRRAGEGLEPTPGGIATTAKGALVALSVPAHPNTRNAQTLIGSIRVNVCRDAGNESEGDPPEVILEVTATSAKVGANPSGIWRSDVLGVQL